MLSPVYMCPMDTHCLLLGGMHAECSIHSPMDPHWLLLGGVHVECSIQGPYKIPNASSLEDSMPSAVCMGTINAHCLLL